jgi:nucleotide-binding universal stress UspA family protein
MEYKTIVCGVTASAHAQKAAIEAAVLAKAHHATLIYVYAVDTAFLSGRAVEISHHSVEESLLGLGRNILDHAAQLAKTQGMEAKKVLKQGPVLDVLKETVLEEKADLLIIGHEARSFFEKAMFKGEVESHVTELENLTGASVSVIR